MRNRDIESMEFQRYSMFTFTFMFNYRKRCQNNRRRKTVQNGVPKNIKNRTVFGALTKIGLLYNAYVIFKEENIYFFLIY